VQVSFLGVGGLIIRWQGQAIMTAPLYSNPTVGEMALSEIHVDRQRIAELMREDVHPVKDVRAILSGHSHYDHLLEVPYVALERAKGADVLGNDAMLKLLASIKTDLGTKRSLVSLQHQPWSPAYKVAGTDIQVRAVVSQHSPQIGPRLQGRVASALGWLFPLPDVSLWRGEDEQDLPRLPTRVGEWMGGTTLAYVIELLQPGTDDVAFRIYYQDSPTQCPYGYPPRAGETYDLAVLCVGGSTEYRAFPQDIVRHLDPRFVMGIHWEDFFNPRKLPPPRSAPRDEDIVYAPGVEEEEFLDAVVEAQPEGGRAMLPCPDTTVVFTRTGGTWTATTNATPWFTRVGKRRPPKTPPAACVP
jgi:L-ascorbate metabolism protein UlaG (beta-lactamase superfamily)